MGPKTIGHLTLNTKPILKNLYPRRRGLTEFRGLNSGSSPLDFDPHLLFMAVANYGQIALDSILLACRLISVQLIDYAIEVGDRSHRFVIDRENAIPGFDAGALRRSSRPDLTDQN